MHPAASFKGKHAVEGIGSRGLAGNGRPPNKVAPTALQSAGGRGAAASKPGQGQGKAGATKWWPTWPIDKRDSRVYVKGLRAMRGGCCKEEQELIPMCVRLAQHAAVQRRDAGDSAEGVPADGEAGSPVRPPRQTRLPGGEGGPLGAYAAAAASSRCVASCRLAPMACTAVPAGERAGAGR